MVKFNIKDLVSAKAFREKRRILMKEVSDDTGISVTTLSLIANSKGNYKTNTEILEKLCIYFNCTPNDLMTIVPDEGESEGKG